MSSSTSAEHLAIILAASQHAVTEDTLQLLQDRRKIPGESPSQPALTARMFEALAVLERHGTMFRRDFAAWLIANWYIWERFSLEADRIWATGRTHYGARTIIEFIRHETALREVNSTLKVNNSFIPDMGRLYDLLNPSREDFFECRVMSDAGVRQKIRSRMQATATAGELDESSDSINVGSLGAMADFVAE